MFQKTKIICIPQNTNKKSYSLWDLVKIAKKYKVELRGFKLASKETFLETIKASFLAEFADADAKTSHLVFIKKANKFYVTVYDSAKGIYKLKTKDFLLKWSGVYLLCTKHEKLDFRAPDRSFYSKKYNLFSCFIQVLSFLSLILGFYFTTKDAPILIPFVCFGGYFAFTLFSYYASFLRTKIFDKAFIREAFIQERKDLVSNYNNIIKFRTMFLTNSSSLIATILTIILISTILIVNNSLNLIYISVIGLIAIGSYIFDNTYLKNKKKDVSLCENKMRKNKNLNDKEYKQNLSDLSENSQFLFGIMMVKKTIIYFLIGIVCLSLMALDNNISLNYLVFHYIFFSILFERIIYLAEYNEKLNEYKVLRAKLISFICKQ